MDPVTVPAKLDSLQSIGRYVLTAAERAGLDRSRAYRLRLAVDEVATNVITHGGDLGVASETIAVWAELDDEGLTIALEDNGPEYDPRTTPVPQGLDRPLNEREIGGLGIYLAIRGVDVFQYERVGNRNRHLFTMARPAATA